MDLLTTVLHELGHVLGFDDQQVGNPTTATLMTETLGDGIRRTLAGLDGGGQLASGKWQAASDPDSSRSAGDVSRFTSHVSRAVPNFMGLFSVGNQQPVRSTDGPSAPSPVIDWGEEEDTSRPTPLDLGGVKLKSSWLSKFLSATGLKQEHPTAQDFEVTLPKK